MNGNHASREFIHDRRNIGMKPKWPNHRGQPGINPHRSDITRNESPANRSGSARSTDTDRPSTYRPARVIDTDRPTRQ